MPVATISGEDAYRNLRGRASLWPDERVGDQRLSGLVSLELTPSFGISRADRIMTLGSCFARRLEDELHALGFDVPMKLATLPSADRPEVIDADLLTKFTIQSIENELRWASGEPAPAPEALFLQVADDQWFDPQLIQSGATLPLVQALARRQTIQAAVGRFAQCRIVIVTLGLAEAWFDEETKLYLNVAPPQAVVRRHPGRFQLHVLSHDDMLAALERVHDLLREKGHPETRMLLTVSPVPFKATFSGGDVISANSYSKSVQRAACEAFIHGREGVDYFPSYEIVAMSPRDVAYEADNLHVAPAMVRHIMAEVLGAYAPGTATEAAPSELAPSRRNMPLGEHFDGLAKAKHLNSLGEEAEAVCREVIDTYGARMPPAVLSAARQVWAAALRAQRRWAEAAQQLEQAAALDPRGGEVFYKLGQCREKLGRFDDAVDAFRQAVSLDSARPEFIAALERVQAKMGAVPG